MKYVFVLLVIFISLLPNLLAFPLDRLNQKSDPILELVNKVDADKIVQHIEKLTDNPTKNGSDQEANRWPDGAGADQLINYISNEFSSYGLEVNLDRFTPTKNQCNNSVYSKFFNNKEFEKISKEYWVCPPKSVNVSPYVNIVATLPGEDNSKVFLITAHYDASHNLETDWWVDRKTRPSPGANDNTSGISIMLETARILSGAKLKYTVIFVAFAAEEYGLWGSQRFANKNGNLPVKGFVNMDMIGIPHGIDFDHVIINDGDCWSIQISDIFKKMNTKYQFRNIRFATQEYDQKLCSDWDNPDAQSDQMAGMSDQLPLWCKNFSGIYIGPSDSTKTLNDKTYHTRQDTLYTNPNKNELRLDSNHMAKIAKLVIASISDQNMADSRLIDNDETVPTITETCQSTDQNWFDDFSKVIEEWWKEFSTNTGKEIDVWWKNFLADTGKDIERWLETQLQQEMQKLLSKWAQWLDKTSNELEQACYGSISLVFFPIMVFIAIKHKKK
jgi:hypothetical protein